MCVGCVKDMSVGPRARAHAWHTSSHAWHAHAHVHACVARPCAHAHAHAWHAQSMRMQPHYTAPPVGPGGDAELASCPCQSAAVMALTAVLHAEWECASSSPPLLALLLQEL